MSITDELRKWANDNTVRGEVLTTLPAQHPVRGTVESLLRIADRIDAEHEDAVRKKAARMLTKTSEYMNDDDLAEIGLVRLPVDADGVPIRVGDVMAYADNTKPMEVVALVPPAVFLTEYGPRFADMCRHYKPPTVEDVLTDFARLYDSIGGRENEDELWETLLAEYAAKLQLKENA